MKNLTIKVETCLASDYAGETGNMCRYPKPKMQNGEFVEFTIKSKKGEETIRGIVSGQPAYRIQSYGSKKRTFFVPIIPLNHNSELLLSDEESLLLVPEETMDDMEKWILKRMEKCVDRPTLEICIEEQDPSNSNSLVISVSSHRTYSQWCAVYRWRKKFDLLDVEFDDYYFSKGIDALLDMLYDKGSIHDYDREMIGRWFNKEVPGLLAYRRWQQPQLEQNEWEELQIARLVNYYNRMHQYQKDIYTPSLKIKSGSIDYDSKVKYI